MWKFLKKEDPNHLYDGDRLNRKMAGRGVIFYALFVLVIVIILLPYFSIK